jgi:hypothetical protein
MIVNEWPKTITTEAGIICNPNPEQCRAAGYELSVQPTPEEIEQQAALQAAQEAAHMEAIEDLRKDYRFAVERFCMLAGIQIVSKFEDEEIMKAAIESANAGGNIQQILGLTQLSIAIQNSIIELRRKDGDDAWQRI